jgi:hypothetical protein
MEDTAPPGLGIHAPSTPLGAAIREIAERLPAVTTSPPSIRSARKAEVVITADAMADAGDMDSNDPSLAGQVVDEAAISLDLQTDRTVDVDLTAPVLERHHELADSLGANLPAVEAGLDDPRSLARVEEAIGRALRMRGEDPTIGDPRIADMVAKLLETCSARHTPVDDMSDGDLMHLVEDMRDAT